MIIVVEENFVQVQKFMGKQLRSRRYRVRTCDVITVPVEPSLNIPRLMDMCPDITSGPVISQTPKFIKQDSNTAVKYHDPAPVSSSDDSDSDFRYSDYLPQSAPAIPTDPVSSSDDSDNDFINDYLPQSAPDTPTNPPIVNRRSKRQRRPPQRLNDYIRGSITPLPNSSDDQLSDPEGT